MIVEASCLVAIIVVGLSAAYALLAWTAAQIPIDDYSTVCFGRVSKLSMVTKLAYLCGLSVPRLERARFAFFPAAHANLIGGKPDRGDGISMEGGLEREGLLSFLQNSTTVADSLVVAFSGGATNKVGLPRLELRRTLCNTSSTLRTCDQLFVLDPTGMSFYAHNFGSGSINVEEEASFSGTLRRVFRCYRRVVLVGNCMGATGALRCAALFPKDAEATQGGRRFSGTVLAFNPEVDPASDARLGMQAAAWLAPRVCAALWGEVTNALAASGAGRVHVHCSAWPPERQQAEKLECEAEVELPDSQDLAALRRAVDSAGGRVVRFVHSGVRGHGLVSGALRGSGALGALLDQAVTGGVRP